MLITDKWSDYELIDAADGEKLERWGEFLLIRPDPQAIWKEKSDESAWKKADAHFHRDKRGNGGSWEFYREIPQSWCLNYGQLKFNVRPTTFKHTGLFPEQGANWDFIIEKIKKTNRKIKLLNLFAYTGGATAAAAFAGAEVVHVDSAKSIVNWAKNNLNISELKDAPVRYIVDDVNKFTQREIRRGNKYDCIIMDPPSYGRGPGGEVWKFDDEFYSLAKRCLNLLSDNPLFVIVNSYTSSVSSTIVSNVISLGISKKYGGTVTSGEICIPIKASGLLLPCGSTTRWENCS